jgi:hypothetical protein
MRATTDAKAYNQLAWIMATCPDPRYRNAREAVAHGTKACELRAWKSWGYIDTLAAAYAEAGDFEQAVKWQTKAVELAGKNDKQAVREHLELYKAGKPYRE